MRKTRRLGVLGGLLLAGAGALVLALASGEVAIAPLDALRAALGADAGPAAEVVRQLRLPRALGTFACGGLLALAGALMQVLLRNPLADPYVLGISGGAAVGALLSMLAGLALGWVNLAALAGALVVTLLVLGLSHGEGGWTATRMLLTGVILASGASALIALILSLAPPAQLPGMLFWLMGDAAAIAHPGPALALLGVALLALWPLARELNLLSAGAITAQALGVPVARLRVLIYLMGALLTAGAVTTVGAVGFVGLIVPHAMRFVIGPDHRLLLPAAALAGGTLLCVADTCARSLLAPLQLPVGVLMALFGVPIFLLLLARQGRAS